MVKNEKYLTKRGDCWYIDCRLPKRFGGHRLRQSLNTSDDKVARNVRDKYIIPTLLANTTIELLEEIGRNAQGLLTEAEKNLAALKNIKIAENHFSLYDCIFGYIHFLPGAGLRKKTIQSYTSAMRKMESLFPDCDLNRITKDMAVNARDAMINGTDTRKIGPTRIKFNFQAWRCFLRWCIGQGYIDIAINEMLNIPLPKVRKKNTSYIPADSADVAVNVLSNWTLAPRIARYTGMRLGEVVKMNPDLIIDRHGMKCFYVPAEISKTHEERTVPIAKKLLPYINDLSELPKTGKKNDKYNRKLKEVRGCEKCSFHSWRVYANTQMMQAGVDETVRKRIIGHKDGKAEIHAGYTHVRLEEMKKAVDLIK